METGERRLAAGGRDSGLLARWGTEEDIVYLVEPSGASASIVRRNLATGERTVLKEVRAPDPAGVTRFDLWVARDGETYAYTLDRQLTNLFILEGL